MKFFVQTANSKCYGLILVSYVTRRTAVSRFLLSTRGAGCSLPALHQADVCPWPALVQQKPRPELRRKTASEQPTCRSPSRPRFGAVSSTDTHCRNVARPAPSPPDLVPTFPVFSLASLSYDSLSRQSTSSPSSIAPLPRRQPRRLMELALATTPPLHSNLILERMGPGTPTLQCSCSQHALWRAWSHLALECEVKFFVQTANSKC